MDYDDWLVKDFDDGTEIFDYVCDNCDIELMEDDTVLHGAISLCKPCNNERGENE